MGSVDQAMYSAWEYVSSEAHALSVYFTLTGLSTRSIQFVLRPLLKIEYLDQFISEFIGQACLEQEARVAELRSLAARVAAETGSRALQADADALARRLQLVAGAVRALADLGEARDLARVKAHHAKDKFCDMKQDLDPVNEESEIVEDKLIALRDNLIALGKSEGDIAPAKAELPDIDRDVSEEHSIVRILELWQAMFRDTFLHYHRLSTALVRSGDAATALKLWHEYLLDLQSFLSGSVPADYENLTEHRRLCRVHRNLLASQRSVLVNENKETTNRELADKFDTLTNLHNETLARIVERHDEVCTRIAAWDDYRDIYTELLRWLKEIEREKEKLQLRYVHIKRVNKILSKIQNLSDKLPEGRKFADKLSVYLKRVLVFTDDTYGASVRMEYAGIVKRVDNLQASLDTWRDFLTRILGLIGEYENLTGELHKLYSRTQDEIMSYSDDDRLSRPQIKKAIEKYSETRKKIDKTENQIEALSVIQEQLKECLSPQDIRIVNQKVWQMRQQRADLEHQLSIIIHRLQERLEIYTIFTSRITRFSEWMTTLESRLDNSSSEVNALDPQDLIRKINSDIQADTALKEREFEWLTETGSTLVDLSKKDEKSFSKNVSKQLKDVQERWQRLQETGRSRIAKINELLETISQLEERLTEIRLKLHSIESKLTATVVIENLTTRAVDEKFQNRDEIHKSIEHESGEVGETLNLCELVFNDPDALSGNFDLRNLRTGVDIVDKKWKNICEMSERRKNALKEIRKSAELANSLLPKVEKKLDGIEKRVEKVEIRKQRGDVDDDSVSKAALKDLDALEEDVKRLEDTYGRIASTRGVELRGAASEHAGRLRVAARRWRQLRARIAAAGTDLQRQFVAAHGSAVVALAEADVRLTRALHLAPTPTDSDATLKELDGVEAEIGECRALVAEADRLEAALAGAGGSAALAAEYRALLHDVTTRLDLARSSLLAGADVDSAVQVDTLTWETDAALQVDTLTSKETYSAELAAAVRETSDALEALRTALQYELKEDAGGDEMATAAKEIAKAGAKPGQTLELAKHLSELLLTECDATEDEAMLKEVESLSLRYEDLLTQAKKRELQINNLRLPHSASYALTCEHESGRLTCPLCSDRNWKQLDNDLWRLEQWLQFAEATDEARTDPPHNYDALEDAIQDHREFLLDLDSHKALVVSLNVVGAHVAQHAREPAAGERARARLAAANARWDTACARAAAWQTRLQHALVHNQQFHDIVEELVGQLSEAESCVRSREPLRLRRAPAELRADFRRFSELRDELARAEPRVQALRDAAALLHGADSQHVCRRLGELRLRLQSLRKLSAVYALKLGAALARHPAAGPPLAAAAAAALAPQLLEEEEEQMSLGLPPLSTPQGPVSEESEAQSLGRVQRGLRFVCRVARASLPFQALLLLLLGAAALAPQTHNSPHACGPALALDPVLRYPDGPPPL
ncbi:Nesprin-1 [Papilio machaon]|uniref:Nesprin-1 n=1 Tax=Papilio machaon TaxID=76193 RepID=A0A194QMV9_PAPMA|nr:Nesprin-1 [Papilio machaon]